jgi:sigma-B regulation protein RsbU (phosphoserine phosphatase)
MFPYATFENVKARFGLGGLLVICSDAAPEAEDPQGTPFGDLRLRDLVGRVRNMDVAAIPNAIINALNDWRGGNALEDDLTVLALKRTQEIV